MTQILFTILCLLVFFFARCAEKRNSNFLLFVCIGILAFVSGFRGEMVGIDTKAYVYSFENNFPIPWQFEEEGFRYISRTLMSLFNNPTIVIFIYSTITHVLIVLRLWDFRNKCSFSFMIFLYETIYFIESMNIMRQFLAIALLFYFTRWLERKKYLSFFVVFLIAVSIHTTALMGIVFLLIYLWENMSKRQKMYLFIPFFILSVCGCFGVYIYSKSLIYNYLIAGIANNNINITFIYRVFVFVLVLVLEKNSVVISMGSKTLGGNNMNIYFDDKNEIRKIKLFYLLGLSVAALGMFFSYLTRAGYYFLMYEVVFWGGMTRNKRNGLLYIILISILAIYIYVHELLFNGSGVFPYYLSFK